MQKHEINSHVKHSLLVIYLLAFLMYPRLTLNLPIAEDMDELLILQSVAPEIGLQVCYASLRLAGNL